MEIAVEELEQKIEFEVTKENYNKRKKQTNFTDFIFILSFIIIIIEEVTVGAILISPTRNMMIHHTVLCITSEIIPVPEKKTHFYSVGYLEVVHDNFYGILECK